MGVAQHLNFNMARLLNKLFNEHAVVAKAVARFVAATGKTFQSFLVVEGHTQAFAAAASTGFNHHRVADALGNFDRLLGRVYRVVHAGYAVHPRSASQLFRLDLVAHSCDGAVLGADENNTLLFHPLGKARVLT